MNSEFLDWEILNSPHFFNWKLTEATLYLVYKFPLENESGGYIMATPVIFPFYFVTYTNPYYSANVRKNFACSCIISFFLFISIFLSRNFHSNC